MWNHKCKLNPILKSATRSISFHLSMTGWLNWIQGPMLGPPFPYDSPPKRKKYGKIMRMEVPSLNYKFYASGDVCLSILCAGRSASSASSMMISRLGSSVKQSLVFFLVQLFKRNWNDMFRLSCHHWLRTGCEDWWLNGVNRGITSFQTMVAQELSLWFNGLRSECHCGLSISSVSSSSLCSSSSASASLYSSIS